MENKLEILEGFRHSFFRLIDEFDKDESMNDLDAIDKYPFSESLEDVGTNVSLWVKSMKKELCEKEFGKCNYEELIKRIENQFNHYQESIPVEVPFNQVINEIVYEDVNPDSSIDLYKADQLAEWLSKNHDGYGFTSSFKESLEDLENGRKMRGMEPER